MNTTNKNQKTPISSSLLNTLNHVPVAIDGVTYVNIDHKSDSELGKRLSPLYPIAVKTMFGNIGTIKNFMDFIATPGYPYELLSMKKFGSNEIKRVPRNRKSVPNYWAIVAYALCERIRTDSKLVELMQANTDPYTSFSKLKPGTFFDKEISMSIPNIKMSRYLSIIRHIEQFIKEDKLNDETILSFINLCRDDVSKEVFDEMAVKVSFTTPAVTA